MQLVDLGRVFLSKKIDHLGKERHRSKRASGGHSTNVRFPHWYKQDQHVFDWSIVVVDRFDCDHRSDYDWNLNESWTYSIDAFSSAVPSSTEALICSSLALDCCSDRLRTNWKHRTCARVYATDRVVFDIPLVERELRRVVERRRHSLCFRRRERFCFVWAIDRNCSRRSGAVRRLVSTRNGWRAITDGNATGRTLLSCDAKSLSFNVNTGISSSWLLSDRIKGKGWPRRYRLWIALSSLVLSRTGVTVISFLSNNLTRWSECKS